MAGSAPLVGLLAWILAVQGLFALEPPIWAVGALDETAHLSTAAIVLGGAWMLGWRPPAAVLLAALAASVLIDVDHIPQALAVEPLTTESPRPRTHALITPLVVLAIAACVRGRARPIAAAVALGMVLHFSRDIATGPGLSLLWPLSDDVVRVPFALYFAALAGLLGVAIAAPRRRQRRLA